jgi:hypothetical protein
VAHAWQCGPFLIAPDSPRDSSWKPAFFAPSDFAVLTSNSTSWSSDAGTWTSPPLAPVGPEGDVDAVMESRFADSEWQPAYTGRQVLRGSIQRRTDMVMKRRILFGSAFLLLTSLSVLYPRSVALANAQNTCCIKHAYCCTEKRACCPKSGTAFQENTAVRGEKAVSR